MPNSPTERATLPPGPADAAAADFERELVQRGTDRSAAFWAEAERAGRLLGVGAVEGRK